MCFVSSSLLLRQIPCVNMHIRVEESTSGSFQCRPYEMSNVDVVDVVVDIHNWSLTETDRKVAMF